MSESAETDFADEIVSEGKGCHHDDFLFGYGKKGLGGGDGGAGFS